MPQPLAELGRARAVGAVVFDGTLEAVDSVLKELRANPRIRVIYIRTGAGKLRIVEGP